MTSNDLASSHEQISISIHTERGKKVGVEMIIRTDDIIAQWRIIEWRGAVMMTHESMPMSVPDWSMPYAALRDDAMAYCSRSLINIVQ